MALPPSVTQESLRRPAFRLIHGWLIALVSPSAIAQSSESLPLASWIIVILALSVLTLLLSAALLMFRLRRDLREREAELAAQARMRDVLLNMLPIPIAVRDAELRYRHVNNALVQYLDVAAHVTIGRTLEEIVDQPGRTGTLADAALRMQQSSTARNGERLEFTDPRGVARHALYWQRPVHDAQGVIESTVSAIVDITEVVEAQRRIEDVTRNLPAMVFQMRRTADGNMSCPFLGGDFGLPSGVSRDALRSDPNLLGRYVLLEDLPGLLHAVTISARELTPLTAEFRILAAQERWLKVSAVPRSEADGTTLWNGYWTDVTEEHVRNAELAAARAAADALMQDKERFLAIMSHEIRTPMSGVLGLAEVLASSQLGDEQRAMVRMIQESAGVLMQILDDILDVSKIAAGKLKLEHAPLDLRELCDVTLGLLASKAHDKSLLLRSRIGERVAARHYGDSVRLRQVLFNLVGNAIKFTQTGEVSLEIDVQAEADHRQTLHIVVCDTGIGIDAAAQQKLFSPFVQADLSTTRRFGGSGLGLTISKRLVELMDGLIELESEPGQGTAMTLRLPLDVEMARSVDKLLSNVRAVVMLRTPTVARGVADGLSALGMQVHMLDPAMVTPAELRATSVVDLLLQDVGAATPAAFRNVPAVQVGDQREPAGYRMAGEAVFLSANPLSTIALRAACRAALTGEPDTDGPADEKAPMPRSREVALQEGALILVAEDNPVNRHVILSQLNLLGCTCELAPDGDKALALYHESRPAIVLTDGHMPGMDGFALAAAIRADEQGRGFPRMPIVCITASVDMAEIEHSRTVGIDDYLRKPVQLHALRACLQRWAPACLPLPPGRLATSGVPQPSTLLADAELPPPSYDKLQRELGSASAVRQLLAMFAASARDDMAALAALLTAPAPDVNALRQWAHRVSGAAAVLHYAPLTTALAQFQRTVQQGDVQAVDPAGRQLLASMDRIATHLGNCQDTVELNRE